MFWQETLFCGTQFSKTIPILPVNEPRLNSNTLHASSWPPRAIAVWKCQQATFNTRFRQIVSLCCLPLVKLTDCGTIISIRGNFETPLLHSNMYRRAKWRNSHGPSLRKLLNGYYTTTGWILLRANSVLEWRGGTNLFSPPLPSGHISRTNRVEAALISRYWFCTVCVYRERK